MTTLAAQDAVYTQVVFYWTKKAVYCPRWQFLILYTDGILSVRLKVVRAYSRNATDDDFSLGLAVLASGVTARRICFWMCPFSENGFNELQLIKEALSVINGSGPFHEGGENSPQRHSVKFQKT
jgi:hypothetical protein